ncbi:MAG: BMP family ABC transporter substrate-binding protein [Anaerovoracaceae bacterium]
MKKIISILLVLVMVLSFSLLTACGDKGDDKEAITVAVVVADGFGDRSFYDSAKAGLDKLEADCGIIAKTTECKGENFKQAMMNAAEVADIVVPVGWQFYDIEAIAPDYPDTKFIWVDNEMSTTLDNVLCISYAQNEGSFLAGYIAAKMSKTNVVGAVGGEDNAVINDFFAGYEQGAKYANKDCKFVKNYANDFEDPAQGKECATSLNSKGADVIFQVAGNTGSGVFEAAKENNFYAIGVDSDQKYIDPDRIICSMQKEVGKSIYDVIKDFVDNGTWEANRTWIADMATGYIQIGYGEDGSKQQISDELKAEVKDLADKIISGEIKVNTTRK